MKIGTKLLSGFFKLPLTRRFAIANELGLVNEGETFENSNDKLYSTFFERAYNKKVLGEMWGKIFINEENPFT